MNFCSLRILLYDFPNEWRRFWSFAAASVFQYALGVIALWTENMFAFVTAAVNFFHGRSLTQRSFFMRHAKQGKKQTDGELDEDIQYAQSAEAICPWQEYDS